LAGKLLAVHAAVFLPIESMAAAEAASFRCA